MRNVSAMHVDNPDSLSAAMVTRYGGVAPSYACYPDVAHFRDDFDWTKLKEMALDSNDEPIPRSLSLDVHLPLEGHDARGGDGPHAEPSLQHYLLCLTREIELMSPWFDRDREVLRLHVVGSTLNVLATQSLYELVDTLQRQFTFAHTPRLELGIEVDPRSTCVAQLHSLSEMGFNQLSFALRERASTSPSALDETSWFERTRQLIDAARTLGFQAFSMALSFGLPQQTLADFAHTLG
ncbi:MAG: hypothetical protein L0H70_09250, partial [Xanthomonadales bacterium]|nr:hypothetical protein [Xanthomonadales bacterium]